MIRLSSFRLMDLSRLSPPIRNSVIRIPITLEDWMRRKLPSRVNGMPEPKSVRFGMIGCGTASIPVGEAIVTSPLTQLTVVYDVNEDLAKDISQRFQVPVVKSMEELLASNVDAVYIAVPHYLLASLTRKVLEAGKHALTEKPLAISLEDADRLIKLASEQQLELG